MARTAKYKTADDLINNTLTRDMCMVWPVSEFAGANQSPVLSPYAPLTKVMLTNSVSRILFITCRYVPASRRLVKWCKTPHCVNPYHYSENTATVARRFAISTKEGKAGGFFTGLLPEQERIASLLPQPEDIEAARPVELDVLKLLQESAMLSGVDARGLPPALRQHKELPTDRMPDSKPVLMMRGVTDRLIEKRSTPDASDEEVDALFDGSIFKAIEARKQRLAMTKALDDWDK
jgi:hypothetical protein